MTVEIFLQLLLFFNYFMGTAPRVVMVVTVKALPLFVSYKQAVMLMLLIYSDIVETITTFLIPLIFVIQPKTLLT